MTAGIILALILAQTPICEDKKLAPEFEMKVLPTGQFCQLKDGTQRECYDLETFKKLVAADIDCRSDKAKLEATAKIVEGQAQLLQQKDLIIKTHEADAKIYEEQVKRLDGNWKACLDEQSQLDVAMVIISASVGIVVGVAMGVAGALLVTSVM